MKKEFTLLRVLAGDPTRVFSKEEHKALVVGKGLRDRPHRRDRLHAESEGSMWISA